MEISRKEQIKHCVIIQVQSMSRSVALNWKKTKRGYGDKVVSNFDLEPRTALEKIEKGGIVMSRLILSFVYQWSHRLVPP